MLRTNCFCGMKTALVFDEDVNNLYSFTFALTNIGWEVLTSSHCDNIVEQVHQSNPSVILITNNLSSQRALISCKILKQHPALSHIPVVCYGSKSVYEEVTSAGANFYVAMPFEFKKLENVLSEAYMMFKSTAVQKAQTG